MKNDKKRGLNWINLFSNNKVCEENFRKTVYYITINFAIIDVLLLTLIKYLLIVRKIKITWLRYKYCFYYCFIFNLESVNTICLRTILFIQFVTLN